MGVRGYDDNLSLSLPSHPALVGLYRMIKLATFQCKIYYTAAFVYLYLVR